MTDFYPPLGIFERRLFHAVDEKVVNTSGGTFTSGAYRTRDLNLVRTNEIAGASLASNIVTLPAGDYFILASAPAFSVNKHKSRVRDTVSGQKVGGTSENAEANVATRSFVGGRLSLTAAGSVIIEHQCLTTISTNGLGVASNFVDVEVFSEIMIWKL